MKIGSVAKLWRYPVKSMLGEELSRVQIDARGFDGDRLFALRDIDGKFGSGKNSRRFRQIDGLLDFRAHYSDGSPEIQFPDGQRLRGADPQTNSALSAALGVPVTLVREQQVSHLDAGPLHIVSTGALAWLRSQLPQSQIDERRFRPNIVVATDESGQPERSWIGNTLRIGPDVRIKVTAATERCRMTTLDQGDLPNDPGILRCLAQEAGVQFGVYAIVVTPGHVSRGDSVNVELSNNNELDYPSG